MMNSKTQDFTYYIQSDTLEKWKIYARTNNEHLRETSFPKPRFTNIKYANASIDSNKYYH